jgi:hypothetical protein
VPNDPNYYYPTDLADHAISWIRAQKTLTPDKPFFIYYASPGTHAPSRVPAAWRDRYKGKFDMGWDKYRDEILAAPGNLRRLRRDIRLRDRPRDSGSRGHLLSAFAKVCLPEHRPPCAAPCGWCPGAGCASRSNGPRRSPPSTPPAPDATSAQRPRQV